MNSQHAKHGRKPFRNTIGAGMALLGVLISGLAAGQEASWKVNPGLVDKWMLQIGAYWPNVKTTGRLDSTTLGRGTTVDFEDDLDLSDRETLGQVLARVRLGKRWRIEFEYFALDRSGTQTINKTIDWGGNSYPIGTSVTTEFDSTIYRLSGGYSFIKDDTKELGVALGLHTTDFSISLSAPNVGVKTGDALAPLPTIGLYGNYAFSPRWMVSGRVDYFSLNYDDYDGSLTNFWAGVDYRFAKHFGVGLGYSYVDYEVEATKTNYTGSLTYKFSGPVLYAVGSF